MQQVAIHIQIGKRMSMKVCLLENGSKEYKCNVQKQVNERALLQLSCSLHKTSKIGGKQIKSEEKEMNRLFKDLRAGAMVHALIKGDDLRYVTGSIVSVGAVRVDMPKQDGGIVPSITPMANYRQVVDVTYCIDGKNYTEAVDVAADMFPTNQLGGLSLVATESEPIVRELHATEKQADDYLKQTETEIPKQKKRKKECQNLIAQLDTSYKERQETDERFNRIEKKQEELGDMLNKILKAVEKK